MTKKIGINFASELITVGLGEGITWNEDQVWGWENLSPEDQAKLQSVINSHVPQYAALGKTWTPLEFKEVFTLEERIAMRQLAKDDVMAEDWLDLLNASTVVRADDPRTIAGMRYMATKGLITQERVSEILYG